MKKFRITDHMLDRFRQQAGLSEGYRLKRQMFVTFLYSQKIGYESGQPFIKFPEQGVLWLIEEKPGLYVLSTFVGLSRMGDCGKSCRAYKAA